MDELSKVMEQFEEEHNWAKQSAECLEWQTEKAVKMQKLSNEITSNFPSSSRAAGVELPGQWCDIYSNSKKPVPEQRRKL